MPQTFAMQQQKEVSRLAGKLPLHVYQAAATLIGAEVGTWVSSD